MKIAYLEKRFQSKSLKMIDRANEIIAEYQAQGFDLTLRQLYYQLVSRAVIPNKQEEYDKLGNLISDARLAGLIDWNSIVDRTRNMEQNSHWSDPQSIILAAERSFALDKWQDQPYRPEVWIEKDALRGVIQGVCSELDIPQFACRGYVSQSEMWRAAMRMLRHADNGQVPYIIHLGDHDPSGIDMTRDIVDRLTVFGLGTEGSDFIVKRVALNWDQVEEYSPPPNPAKMTDSRVAGYIENYGYESWELDALDPVTISDLIRNEIEEIIDRDAWDLWQNQESEDRVILGQIRTNFAKVKYWLENGNGNDDR